MKQITISDVPVIDGRIDYRVPRDTYVVHPSGRVYGEPGDHLHGIRDKAGIACGVYDPEGCAYCAESLAAIVDGTASPTGE